MEDKLQLITAIKQNQEVFCQVVLQALQTKTLISEQKTAVSKHKNEKPQILCT